MKNVIATLFAGCLAFCSFGAGVAFAAPPALGPDDRLRIVVLEWVRSEGTYREWEALGGEFIVAPDGRVALPLVSPLLAEGLQPDAFAADIARVLQERTGLVDPLEVTVSVLAWRPIYVVGDVAQPGEVLFRARMSVMQALAAAGGRRRENLDDPFVGREIVRNLGSLEQLAVERQRAEARFARLMVEATGRDGHSAIDFPTHLETSEHGRTVIAEEMAVYTARQQNLIQQLETIQELETLFAGEIEALNGKIEQLDRQIELVEEEFESIASLVERGLTPANRARGLEREIASLESSRLDLTTSIMRARQNQGEARRSASSLRTERSIEVALQLQATQAELERISISERVAQRLIAETKVEAERLGENREQRLSTALIFSVLRRTPDGLRMISADATTELQPGDVVQVEMQLGGEARSARAPVPLVAAEARSTQDNARAPQ